MQELWPDEIEITLDGIAQGGEGVGRWQERVVFATGGLPGERVRVALSEQRAAYARGLVTEVLDAVPERAGPYDTSDGHMPWRHIVYSAQLRYKRQILAEQLSKMLQHDSLVIEETVAASPPLGYRTTARLHSDGEHVGYYAADTNDIVPIDHDPLLFPSLNEALAALSSALAVEPQPVSIEVLLRASESYGYVIGALESSEKLLMTGMRWRARCPALAGVAVATRPAVVLGADSLLEELGGLTFTLRPTTFFQSGRAAAEVLLGLVEQGLRLEGGEHVLDLYCGAGVFSLPLAQKAAQVIGIEAYGGAVADAQASAALNGIRNVRFMTAAVERGLAEIEEGIQAIVLDPPRRGCHPEALAGILRLAPERIVYVSCHPATLGRDLRILLDGGYSIQRVTPVDLFPQTPHIESVTVLRR
jgi:23S rRNA (uracil1939-C5)-methyltransferase